MSDIFISYSRFDNEDRPAITYQVSKAIDRFLDIYAFELDLTPDRRARIFFQDEWTIEVGQVIPERIARAITQCPVMLAFYSPSYFSSVECLREWQAFDAARKAAGKDEEGRDRKLLIPIELKPVDRDGLEPADPAFFDDWWTSLTTPAGHKRTITSDILVKEGNAGLLAERVRGLGAVINRHLATQRGTSLEDRGRPNLYAFKTPISNATMKSDALATELRHAPKLKYSRHLPVCVIYAGGTVGMVRKPDSDPVHADYAMARDIDEVRQPLSLRLAALPVNIHLFRLAETIDSSAVKAKHWVDLASLIREQSPHYQGFVILHGTNTLAYSASALSFLLSDSISKPVILTGSEVPLSNTNTDAVHNIENAIRAAAHESYGGPILIPEVCVYWNNFLFRGNRVTKKIASDRSASFHCPNMAVPLATLANDKLDVEYMHVRTVLPPTESRVAPIRNIADVDVSILFIHPNMDFAQIDEGFTKSPDGLILLSYGPGNVPEDDCFIKMLERLLADNTIIANITQCPFGRVELKLFETSATLFDLGVIDGYDMTLEAAYTKLLWALAGSPTRASRAQPGTQESIKAWFQEDHVGEMSASIYTQHWPASDFTDSADVAYKVSDTGNFQNKFDRLDIAEAFIRLEGLHFPAGVEKAAVRLYYGHPPHRRDDTQEPDNLLAEFSKTITDAERDTPIDKNLEVTHTFRKAFDNKAFVISVGLEGAPGIEFKSVRLVVYTKGRHRHAA